MYQWLVANKRVRCFVIRLPVSRRYPLNALSHEYVFVCRENVFLVVLFLSLKKLWFVPFRDHPRTIDSRLASTTEAASAIDSSLGVVGHHNPLNLHACFPAETSNPRYPQVVRVVFGLLP